MSRHVTSRHVECVDDIAAPQFYRISPSSTLLLLCAPVSCAWGDSHNAGAESGPSYVQPSIRVCASANLTAKEITFATTEIRKEVAAVLAGLRPAAAPPASSRSPKTARKSVRR